MSLVKGTTYRQTEGCLVYDKPTSATLIKARNIFGIEKGHSDYRGGYLPTRCSTSTTSIKAYNFTRQNVTRVDVGGIRSTLKRIPMNMDFFNAFKRKRDSFTYKKPSHEINFYQAERGSEYGGEETDLLEVWEMLEEAHVNPDRQVIILRYVRIVAETQKELRTAIESMHMPAVMRRMVDVNYHQTMPKNNGFDGFYRDLIFISAISEEQLRDYPSVLEAYSGVQISNYDLEEAPAHVFESASEHLIQNPEAGDSIRAKEGTVARYEIVYHGEDEPQRMFVNDCGVVMALHPVHDPKRQIGFHKTWYEYEEGELKVRSLYLEPSELLPHNGFYVTRTEAAAGTTKQDIKMLKNTIEGVVTRLQDALNNSLNEFARILARESQQILREELKEVQQQAAVQRKRRKEAKARRPRYEDFRKMREDYNDAAEVRRLRDENERFRKKQAQEIDQSATLRYIASVFNMFQSFFGVLKAKKKIA